MTGLVEQAPHLLAGLRLTIRSRRLATLAFFGAYFAGKVVYNASNLAHPQAP
jgi:hypothetical protein